MSRSGYTTDYDDNWSLIMWRGAVASAMRGKRGQTFLREMLAALDALEPKRLIESELVSDGEVCAIGAVGKARGVEMKGIDPEDNELIADTFGIAHALACEIMYTNDEASFGLESPEARYKRVRTWVEKQLRS